MEDGKFVKNYVIFLEHTRPYFVSNIINRIDLTRQNHQKAPGKGGHHLGLFDPTTHRQERPRKLRKRDPPHTTRGPPVIGVDMLLKSPESGGNTYEFTTVKKL